VARRRRAVPKFVVDPRNPKQIASNSWSLGPDAAANRKRFGKRSRLCQPLQVTAALSGGFRIILVESSIMGNDEQDLECQLERALKKALADGQALPDNTVEQVLNISESMDHSSELADSNLIDQLVEATRVGNVVSEDNGKLLVAGKVEVTQSKERQSQGFFTVERDIYSIRPRGSNEKGYPIDVDLVKAAKRAANRYLGGFAPENFEITEIGEAPFIGEGYESVYVYTTKEARTHGLIKIGMSSSASVKGVVRRITKQFGTSNPSPPELLLVIRVEDGFASEQSIHKSLKNCRLDGPGTEWFKATIEDVMDAYHS